MSLPRATKKQKTALFKKLAELGPKESLHNKLPQVYGVLQQAQYAATGFLDFTLKVFLRKNNPYYNHLFFTYVEQKAPDLARGYKIRGFLENGSYEMAVLEFRGANSFVDSRHMERLYAITLLIEASNRNDTETILFILRKLPSTMLTPLNYASLAATALKNGNHDVVAAVYPELTDTEFTGEFLLDLCRIFVENNNLERAFDVVLKVRDQEAQIPVATTAAALLGPTYSWKFLDELEIPISYDELAPKMFQDKLFARNNYEEIEEHFDEVIELKPRTVQLALYAALRSIYFCGHFGSMIFVLRYVAGNNLQHLLENRHFHILFEGAAKHAAKLCSLNILELAARLNIPLSDKDVLALLQCHASGTEHETLYLAISEIRKRRELPDNCVEYLRHVSASTNDLKLKLVAERPEMQMIVPLEHIQRTLDSQQHRTALVHERLPDHPEYFYATDYGNSQWEIL
ncbi:hypothetical protein KL928_000199 [Ogataea angusta]|uniref:Uncharacterized protein n=1 Tax=Pichia angusta TaxID=870730 RepID=A0AAN6I818_PICAN|nr:uncharacterized protein KL928_000199 [Ogataea angusta]KAG7821724.1 hypothetical protein KL928_000199 [Ogataea angusta]